MNDPRWETLFPPVKAIVETLAARPEVVAIALGGSRTSAANDVGSDTDLYVYTARPVPHGPRRDLATRFDREPEIGNRWFGDEDAWLDEQTSITIDLVYWEQRWIDAHLRAVILEHRPSVGYSTALWYTVRQSIALADRDGWFGELQALAASPYPDALRQSIIDLNLPLLATARFSYRHQLALALARRDLVSVNHRSSAFLASVFDLVFAANRLLHPGEKRQMAHLATNGAVVPADFAVHVERLLQAPGDEGSDLLAACDAICADVETTIRLTE
jgi:hypothetical protein